MYSADNSQKEKAKKSSITKYHYYLNKGNFPQYSAWARRHNQVHGKSGDALILIAVAEFENGDLFYDLDATDVEIVENEKGTSSSLEVARIPTTSLQASDVPFSGRLHNLKQYVNHIDNKITGGYSLCVGKKAKNWKSLPGEYFTDSTVSELKKRFDALETADKRRSFSKSLVMFTHNAVDEEVYI